MLLAERGDYYKGPELEFHRRFLEIGRVNSRLQDLVQINEFPDRNVVSFDLTRIDARRDRQLVFVIPRTPAARAQIAGRFKILDNKQAVFVPARLDTGVPAQNVLHELTRDIIVTPEFKSLVGDRPEDCFIWELMRDPCVDLQTGLWEMTGETVPRTQVHISHQKDENPANGFGRTVRICDINHEGISANICHQFYVDFMASGMQLYQTLATVMGDLNRINPGALSLKSLILVSPLATLVGGITIALKAAEYGLDTFIFCASVLQARPPDYYWCFPYSEPLGLLADPSLLTIYNHIYGESGACVQSNWAGRRLNPKFAIGFSEGELKDYGLSNEEVARRAGEVTPAFLRALGVNPSDYVTRQTWLEAERCGLGDLWSPVRELNSLLGLTKSSFCR